MEISDQELRTLVREAIARHTRAEKVLSSGDAPSGGHSSQVLVRVASGADGDGICLIEPSVRCSHCGYCQSFGH